MRPACKQSIHVAWRPSRLAALATAAFATLQGVVCLAARTSGTVVLGNSAGGGSPEQVPPAALLVVVGVLAAVTLFYILRGRIRERSA
jgi:hypothetical protein